MEVKSFSTECSSGHPQEKERKGRERVSKEGVGGRNRRRKRIKGARDCKKRTKENTQMKERKKIKKKMRKEGSFADGSEKKGKSVRKRIAFVLGPLGREIKPLSALQNLEEAMYCFLESPEAKQFQECLAKTFRGG